MTRKDKTVIAEGAFENRTDLVEIKLPDEVRHIEAYAFAGCTKLRSVSLPDGILKIGTNAFLDCKNLQLHTEGVCGYLGNENNPRLALVELASDAVGNTELVIPEGTRILLDGVFYYFLGLGSAVLPNSLEIVSDGAFYHCENMTSIRLGAGIKKIGKNAFYGCDSLTDVYFPGSEQTWRSVKIASVNTRLKKAKMHFLQR